MQVKIIIEDRNPDEEDTILIRCKDLDESLLKLIYNLKMGKERIAGIKDQKAFMVEPDSIYYFEAVDNKVFFYCEHEVYETKLKLYEIEKEFEQTDFFRASKSTIVNLSKIKSIHSIFNGRFEAVLKNQERVIISRQYVADLKKRFGL
ncbi:LytTR family DNA-binding domain-containing protein [Konateibacter massiliensis]|uniref:LytTR family DNA-binding domain-containing protein n=1 Tax=Konateibacter massiliensis TaxID=2002841 RepID=UPI000C1505AD|nr:LytTR family DNA-binding domain-containing protein [Konateibacter massiliensis]